MKNKDKLRQHEEANRKQQQHGFDKPESGKSQPSWMERDREKMKDREREPASSDRF